MSCRSFLRIRPLFSQAQSVVKCAKSNSSRANVPCTFGRRSDLIGRNLTPSINYYYSTLAKTEKQLMKKDLIYPNILVTVKGYDAGVLDHYCQFIKSAGHIFDLEVTKQFNLPTEKFSQTLANLPDSYKKHKTKYELKKHSRMIQIKEIPVEKADVWLQFVQSNLPEGVNIHIQLKKWQDFVSPPDPRIEEQKRLDYLRKKGKFPVAEHSK